MNRFKCIKCVHCGKTVRRPNMAPLQPLQTCLVCGQTTNLNSDIPLKDLKSESEAVVDLLTHGKWTRGLAETARLMDTASKHFCMPVSEVVEAQIAIWKCMWLRYGNMKHVKMI